MNPPPSPFAAMQLRANPFLPELTIRGQQIQFDYLRGPLSPQENGMPLNFYFDLYDWRDQDQVGKIGQDGRIREFPDRFGQPGMIIVISGGSQTGRSSLENLLLFEVKARSKTKPIRTEFKIEISSNKVVAAHNFALTFVSDIVDYVDDLKRIKGAKALPGKLRATIAAWKASVTEGEPNTEFLFQQLTRDVRKTLPDTPIVFCLDASSHMNTPDTWRPACVMLRNLADFVLLSLSKPDHAAYLRTSLRDSQMRAAWIDAPRVGADQIKRFLATRLAVERLAPVGHELFPFTEGAIRELFAPTRKGEVITLSIGVVTRRM